MYEFLYDYIKPKYCDSAKLYYISLILKPKIFLKMWLMMLQKDLMHQIIKLTNHCLQEGTKK